MPPGLHWKGRQERESPQAVPRITPAYVQLWTPTSPCPVQLVLLEPALKLFPTHYWQRRTRPCTQIRGHCEACLGGQSRRLTAWIAALVATTRQRVVAQLTAGCLAGCPAILLNDGALLHKVLIVQRRHHGKQAPIDAQVLPVERPGLAAPLDTLRVLAAVWDMPIQVLEEIMRNDDAPTAVDKPLGLSDTKQP